MCGFLTWVTAEPVGDTPPADALESGLQRIAHRGPDDTHVVGGTDHWVGFRRLAILDLSTNGRQPMLFEDGRYVLAFNGEIYNYRDLARHLEGNALVSTGDSEVLGHLFVKFGVKKTLSLLRGMFAFTWWDRREKELYAARDHFGIKPLYYATTRPRELALCSELKGLLGLPGIERRVDPAALVQYFTWGAVQAPSVIVDDIDCLRPGHYLHWQNGEFMLVRRHEFLPGPREARESCPGWAVREHSRPSHQ
jgi:asparagine synthase (glutamine-hydrolysing)